MLIGHFTKTILVESTGIFEYEEYYLPAGVIECLGIAVELKTFPNVLGGLMPHGKTTIKQGKDLQYSGILYDTLLNPDGTPRVKDTCFMPFNFNVCEPIRIAHENFNTVQKYEVIIIFKCKYERKECA